MFEFCMTSNREGWSEMNYEHSQCAFLQKWRNSVFILSASHYKTMLTWPMCTLQPFIHKRKIKGLYVAAPTYFRYTSMTYTDIQIRY